MKKNQRNEKKTSADNADNIDNDDDGTSVITKKRNIYHMRERERESGVSCYYIFKINNLIYA